MPAHDTQSARTQCSAARLAPAAEAWLAADLPARPLHIFETVCNLVNTEGDILSLMLAPAEMNPLALEFNCVDRPLDLRKSIFPQSDTRLRSNILDIGGLTIEFSARTLWAPAPEWQAAQDNAQNMARLIDEVTVLLRDDHAPESMAVFLQKPLPPLKGWQERARRPINRLLDGLAGKDLTASVEAAQDLAGLGMGLTPSGDDFIIGVMHALWCAWAVQEAEAFCAAMLAAVMDRTNQLSANYLTRAACGEAGEAWHRLIRALAQADSPGLRAPVASLIGLGHTSGQDALAGFLLAARA